MWATKTDARNHWADALSIADATLDELLQVAYVQVYNYAPRLTTHVVTSCSTTNASKNVISSVGGFVDSDVGRSVSGTGVSPSTVIDEVVDGFTAILSANATATGTADLTVSGVPKNYMLGNVFQAREVYAASLRGEQDVIGVGDYAIRARPLTAAVKQLLRPQSGRYVIG